MGSTTWRKQEGKPIRGYAREDSDICASLWHSRAYHIPLKASTSINLPWTKIQPTRSFWWLAITQRHRNAVVAEMLELDAVYSIQGGNKLRDAFRAENKFLPNCWSCPRRGSRNIRVVSHQNYMIWSSGWFGIFNILIARVRHDP